MVPVFEGELIIGIHPGVIGDAFFALLPLEVEGCGQAIGEGGTIKRKNLRFSMPIFPIEDHFIKKR